MFPKVYLSKLIHLHFFLIKKIIKMRLSKFFFFSNISKDKINTITLVKLELTNIMGITES